MRRLSLGHASRGGGQGRVRGGGATTRVSRLSGRARALVSAVRKVAPSLFDEATGRDFL